MLLPKVNTRPAFRQCLQRGGAIGIAARAHAALARIQCSPNFAHAMSMKAEKFRGPLKSKAPGCSSDSAQCTYTVIELYPMPATCQASAHTIL